MLKVYRVLIVSVAAYQKQGFALGVSWVLMNSFYDRELKVLLKKTGSVEAMARVLVIRTTRATSSYLR